MQAAFKMYQKKNRRLDLHEVFYLGRDSPLWKEEGGGHGVGASLTPWEDAGMLIEYMLYEYWG